MKTVSQLKSYVLLSELDYKNLRQQTVKVDL